MGKFQVHSTFGFVIQTFVCNSTVTCTPTVQEQTTVELKPFLIRLTAALLVGAISTVIHKVADLNGIIAVAISTIQLSWGTGGGWGGDLVTPRQLLV